MVNVPDRGDVVMIDFNPTRGHEQAMHRPALVLSPRAYNKKTGLAIMCPITSTTKGYPFEVKLANKEVQGVVLADHLRSLDWVARHAKKITRVKPAVTKEVLEKVNLLLQM